MLSFLVTSKARRLLIELLWGKGASGSCSELAEKAGVAFANAYRELHAMKELDLVTTEHQGRAEVYRANDRNLASGLVRQILAYRPVSPPDDDHADTVRGWLRQMGAPLAQGHAETPPPSEEDALADGVKLAHRDPAVARVLPLCFWYHRDHLDIDRLTDRARRDGEKHALGLLLDVTTEVSSDRRFEKWAKDLRDRRVSRTRDFFHAASLTRRGREHAERNTPPVARRWGYRMNMDVENFRTLFQKFAHHAPVHS